MRAIPGRSDHVVVVGAGLAGLSAALHLAGRGRAVTVVERHEWPGGRTGRLDINGYRIDTGPTVLTMPDIIDDVFAAVGETRSSRLELLPVEPAYHAVFADVSCIDVHSDQERMIAAIAEFSGHDQAAGYRRLRDRLTRLYRIEFDGFIAANFESPLSLLTPQLARLAAISGFRNWDSMVKRYIADSRLRRVFTFQSLYAGVAPQDALAAYAVIAYMAAADAGVRFCYRSTVTSLESAAGRITAVNTDQGQHIASEAVVLTSELPRTYALLGRTPRRLRALRASPSAVVVHVGCRRVRRATRHHTILFGEAWKQTFTDIIRDGRLMSDPSLLVTRPTAGDPSLAPAGRDLLYLLAPAPNLVNSAVDWPGVGATYADTIVDTVQERLVPDLRDNAEVLEVVTPEDWRHGEWRPVHPSRLHTPSARRVPSARPTPCVASTTPCWPGRRPSPAWACRPR
jgi:phytoene desaturase